MPERSLDYFTPPTRRFSKALVIDCLVVFTAVLLVNALLLYLTFHARERNRGAYFIAFGPANAVVGLVSLAATPLVTRRFRQLSARDHVMASLLPPVIALVAWMFFFITRGE